MLLADADWVRVVQKVGLLLATGSNAAFRHAARRRHSICNDHQTCHRATRTMPLMYTYGVQYPPRISTAGRHVAKDADTWSLLSQHIT